MGFRYGKHRFGANLFSRWPGWWDVVQCTNDTWVISGGVSVPAWTPVVVPGRTWGRVV